MRQIHPAASPADLPGLSQVSAESDHIAQLVASVVQRSPNTALVDPDGPDSPAGLRPPPPPPPSHALSLATPDASRSPDIPASPAIDSRLSHSPSEQPSLAADHNASIHSILAAAHQAASQAQNEPQSWSLPPYMPSQQQQQQQQQQQHHAHSSASSAIASSSRSGAGKRKLDEIDAEDPHPKIRRVVRDHVIQPNMPMTTIICLHAAVAQKSYGSEKRFLCPPPVVHIECPVWQMRSQQLSMSVVSEHGERSFELKAPLDAHMNANFKFLHVTGTAKAKSFLLSLDIAEPPNPAADESDTSPVSRVWATFDSAPVTIISKPSKKTAKTRNISSCILAGGPVSLFNRINSQTVRTKYMTIENSQLCASNVAWSAFNVNVVRRTQDVANVSPQPVTYGSEVVLTDTLSGISTAPLIIRKVDKGRIAADDGGPVSQMQKIALQRVNPDGTRHYLSAAGPLPGTTGGITSPPPPPGQAGTHPLIFQTPRVRDEIKDGVRTVLDEVDDYLCWTIVGISKFQYTFFDAFGPNNGIPDMPITPFPTLFTSPVYRPPTNTLELTVSNFFYDNPKTRQRMPLDIYLGGLGPLRARVYEAAPPGPLTNISPFGPGTTDPVAPPADPANGNSAMGRYMQSPLHTIVIVELPPMADVVTALQEPPRPTTPVEGENGEEVQPSNGQVSDNGKARTPEDPAAPPPTGSGVVPPEVAGRSLPLLFIRSLDGIGYHSGRTIAVENVFHGVDFMAGAPQNGQPSGVSSEWLAAAAAQAAQDGNMHGWTLRVV